MSTTKDRLSMLLKEQGISQYQLSKSSGVDMSIICRILKGECEPNVKTLRKIADTTNISPTWLLGYGPDQPIVRL